MNPAIKGYLDEHGATYTRDALRRGLVEAGHDPVEVDAALAEWQPGTTHTASAAIDRRRFWLWAFSLHAGVLLVIAILSLVIGSFATGAWGLLVALAVALLIGLGISGLAGRGALRGGLTVALVLPALSALLIGGSCLALAGSSLLRAPPRTGVMDLHIEAPLSFDGSGVAMCQDFGGTAGFTVWADTVGTREGSVVGVYLTGVPGAASSSIGQNNLSINLTPKSGDRPVGYSTIFSTRLELDATSDGRSGTLAFAGLEPGVGEEPPGQVSGLEPISGNLNWDCE